VFEKDKIPRFLSQHTRPPHQEIWCRLAMSSDFRVDKRQNKAVSSRPRTKVIAPLRFLISPPTNTDHLLIYPYLFPGGNSPPVAPSRIIPASMVSSWLDASENIRVRMSHQPVLTAIHVLVYRRDEVLPPPQSPHTNFRLPSAPPPPKFSQIDIADPLPPFTRPPLVTRKASHHGGRVSRFSPFSDPVLPPTPKPSPSEILPSPPRFTPGR